MTDALGNSDDEFLIKLKDNSLRVGNCAGIRNSALCHAIRMRIAPVATRAEGAEFICHANAGTYPST